MKPLDFDLLDWLNDKENIIHNLGSSCLTSLKLTDIPGYDPKEFDFMLDCGTDMGDPELISEIADQYSVEDENVAITSSASEGNFLVEALFPDGDIAVESPSYEPLWKLAEVLGVRLKWISRPYERGFRFDPEDLKEKVHGCSLLVMTNLHNPSGVGLRNEELREILEICNDAGVMVLVDEIFRHLSNIPSALEFGKNVVINTSPSKFFGACGLRIGHLVGPRELIKNIERLKMLITPNTSVISQRAYLLITQNMDWFIRRGKQLMEPNMQAVANLIEKRDDMEWVPSLGNIAFPRIFDPVKGVKADTMAVGQHLKEKHRLLITPGSYFGETGQGHIRLGYGIGFGNLRKGLKCLEKGLNDWWDIKQFNPLGFRSRIMRPE